LRVIAAYKLAFTGFKDGPGLAGLGLHLRHEFSLLANLFLLLIGFALLSRHFEESRIPDEMPTLLPSGWKGGVTLLAIVFVLSSFLDNIAGAIIGGTVARHVFRGKVHMGYLAAIVAASTPAARAAWSAHHGSVLIGLARRKPGSKSKIQRHRQPRGHRMGRSNSLNGTLRQCGSKF
jgi:hypothetical protein